MVRGEVRFVQAGTGDDIVNNRAAFHPSQASLAAQNFNMPALSPTMTEGNIATWKIKEGATYQAPNTRTSRRKPSDVDERIGSTLERTRC